MIKGPNKPIIIVGKAQELLQLLDNYRGRPVLCRLQFLLIHFYFTRVHSTLEIFHLKLAKFKSFHLGIQVFFPMPLQY